MFTQLYRISRFPCDHPFWGLRAEDWFGRFAFSES